MVEVTGNTWSNEQLTRGDMSSYLVWNTSIRNQRAPDKEETGLVITGAISHILERDYLVTKHFLYTMM